MVVVVATAFAGIEAPVRGAQPDGIDDAAAFRGKLTYETYCKACHGATATGDGALANDLKVRPANLAELAARNGDVFPLDMVIETITHGRSVRGHGSEDMPAWGDAFEMTTRSEAEAKTKMNELAHYLWSLQTP